LAKTNNTLYTLFLVLHQSQPKRRPSQVTQSSAKHQTSLPSNQSIHQISTSAKMTWADIAAGRKPVSIRIHHKELEQC
jgi:hypothetical protein